MVISIQRHAALLCHVTYPSLAKPAALTRSGEQQHLQLLSGIFISLNMQMKPGVVVLLEEASARASLEPGGPKSAWATYRERPWLDK